MCLPYLKERAENFSDNIIYNMPNGVMVLNEALEVQQINRAAIQLFNIANKDDIIGHPVVRILNPATYLDVMTSGRNIHDKLAYLDEHEKYIEETVIYDKIYHIIISIMKDVTIEETLRQKKEKVNQRTIEIADKVIEKQMRVVQEIASLLGETTAETKIALTNLKETLKNE
jgi:transcriptional regulator with PAS, ATPase and Fis domain